MTNSIDTAAIESLQSFAIGYLAGARAEHGDPAHFLAFSHMCTAALQGEEWAVARVESAINFLAGLPAPGPRSKLAVIRTTDCTRPDGAIARGGFQP